MVWHKEWFSAILHCLCGQEEGKLSIDHDPGDGWDVSLVKSMGSRADIGPVFRWSWHRLVSSWLSWFCTCLRVEVMAPHSSALAWKIPWTEEPGGLQSVGSWRVGHEWATSFSLFTFMHWRRKWQPTPGFLPGESQGRGSLVGCRLWGRTESDMTEVT